MIHDMNKAIVDAIAKKNPYLAMMEDRAKASITHPSNEQPVGTIATFQGEDIPEGWLVCDGTRCFKTDYPELSKYLDNLYGNSNLPDMRGEGEDWMRPTLLDDCGEPMEPQPKDLELKHIIKAK